MIASVHTQGDLKEIVEMCNFFNSSDEIQKYISDIFKKVEKSNPNLASSLIEYILYTYQGFELSYQIANIGKVQDFRGLEGTHDNPNLEWLYYYLLRWTHKATPKEYFKMSPTYSKERVIRILQELKEKKFCEFSEVTNVIWIFFSSDDNIQNEKICWVDKISKAVPNHRTLFHFFQLICKVNDSKYTSMFEFIAKCFTHGTEKKKFTIESLKKTHSRYQDTKGIKTNSRFQELEKIFS